GRRRIRSRAGGTRGGGARRRESRTRRAAARRCATASRACTAGGAGASTLAPGAGALGDRGGGGEVSAPAHRLDPRARARRRRGRLALLAPRAAERARLRRGVLRRAREELSPREGVHGPAPAAREARHWRERRAVRRRGQRLPSAERGVWNVARRRGVPYRSEVARR